MSFKAYYSRTFLEKVYSWPKSLKDMAFKAAEHVAQDPELDDYKRDAIQPYRQKHPPTDRQYTLYFLIISKDEIFFVWINDDNCLHTTRANYPDPCQKEFLRLKGRNQLENFDPAIHLLDFKVRPNGSKPFQCRSTFLNHEVTLNSYEDNSIFIGHAFFCDETVDEIAKTHVSLFLEALHEHLTQNKFKFQIQFIKNGFDREIELLSDSHNRTQWAIVPDQEDFILKKL